MPATNTVKELDPLRDEPVPEVLSHAARKKIDIKYHELGSGYFAMLERRGLAPRWLLEDDIRAAMRQPPRDTPAWPGGRSIARPDRRNENERVSWAAG
jgi:Pup amidohydrolase